MSKYLNCPVVGIDVSANFSFVTILAPNGETFRKPFKIAHDMVGFFHLAEIIEKVEKEFDMKSATFMESTGIYHLTLSNFLSKRFNTRILNPLITNSNKNNEIRKVKNDKKDSISIAKLGKYQDIKYSEVQEVKLYGIKSLCREYYSLVDLRSNVTKKLSSNLRIIFPGYHTIFSKVAVKTSLAILETYTTPQSFINEDREVLIDLIAKASRRSKKSAESKYKELYEMNLEALEIGINSPAIAVRIRSNISSIRFYSEQIKTIRNEVEKLVAELANSSNIEDASIACSSFSKNVELLETIPGIGRFAALTIMSEISDINRFKKPKQVVAYFGVDPSVNQSGNFVGNSNRMSKRGSSVGRKALYHAALVSVSTTKNGDPINPVLREYYRDNLKNKKNKQGIVAIMHKLLKYIFSVLKNQKPYELRNPKIHEKMYLENKCKLAA